MLTECQQLILEEFLHNPDHILSTSDLRKRDYMFGLLAFYERGRHEFLAEAFVKAYQKTAPRYAELVSYVQQGGVLGTLG